MVRGKLKWSDAEEIAFRLIDKYPSIDPLSVRFTDLHKFVMGLSDFKDDPKKSNEGILENIQMRWHEERSEMDDELGPVSAADDDEDLDEDDYRDDRPADESEEDVEEEDSGYDDDEFSDGFQEEGEDADE